MYQKPLKNKLAFYSLGNFPSYSFTRILKTIKKKEQNTFEHKNVNYSFFLSKKKASDLIMKQKERAREREKEKHLN